MSKEIGRNDKCPCMSGKKYKNCCARNKEFVDFFKTNFDAQYIDSNYIINSVTSNSSIMYNYLVNNLNKLEKPIVWLYNPKLNANMRSMYAEDFHIIIMKNVPICENDYFDVAHEIGHLLLGELGYPMANITDGDKNKIYLGTILTNTILDPKINKEVVKWGFDFVSYMKKGIDIQIPIVKRYPNEDNLHIYDKHYLKCLLIEKILEWDMFEDGTKNPFEEIYKEKYPIIYSEAINDIKFIKEIGVSTPENAKLILERILKNNEMDDVIKII